MESLNVFKSPQNVPAPGWACRWASESSIAPVGEAGWNPSLAGVRRFSLRFPATSSSESDAGEIPSILLVEDNLGDVGLVRESLRAHQVNCDISVLSDGELAIRFINYLQMAPDACPALVILDLNLPKKSGLQVLESLRRSEKCKDAPVVVLSSSDAQCDQAGAIAQGANRYLRKPSRLNEFLSLGAIFKAMMDRVGALPQ